jgi:ribose 5-phosphate isomerase B
MRIVVASDHAGFALKEIVITHLKSLGHEVDDLGTDSEKPVDYPPFCAAAARAVVRGPANLGIVIGGSGQGEQISANKVHGTRAALCHDEYTARLSRQHNDANVLALGARLVAPTLALDILDVWLATSFEAGRHVPRLEEIAAIEQEECDRRRDQPSAGGR